MDEIEGSHSVRVGVAAALAREYTRDVADFLPYLARMLEQSLPEATRVLTRGFLRKEVSGVEITLGDDRFTFEATPKRGVLAKRAHIVRGIALKTEELSMEEALPALADALEERASSSARSRSALTSFLGL